MAIQIVFDDQNTIFSTAYARIIMVPNNYLAEEGPLVVQLYKSEAASKNKKPPVGSREYYIKKEAQPELGLPAFADFFGKKAFSDEKTDPLKQGYKLLKTLPEYAGGIDLL